MRKRDGGSPLASLINCKDTALSQFEAQVAQLVLKTRFMPKLHIGEAAGTGYLAVSSTVYYSVLWANSAMCCVFGKAPK